MNLIKLCKKFVLVLVVEKNSISWRGLENEVIIIIIIYIMTDNFTPTC